MTAYPSRTDGADADRRAQVLSYILESVAADGSWGRADFEEWGPITTTLTVDLFLACGIPLDAIWYVERAGKIRQHSLRQSIQYLDGSIRPDGSFGEDLWDACRLAQLIYRFSLPSSFTNLSQLLGFIDRLVSALEYRKRDQTWAGPGVLAALVDFYEQRGQLDVAARLFDELAALQVGSGEFRGTVSPDGSDLVSPVWHTAQALITYLNRGLSERDDRVGKMVQWLVDHQSVPGSWRGFSRYETYYTSWGIIALAKLHNPPTQCFKNALAWLTNQIPPSGKVADSGGTIMAAMALCAVHGCSLTAPVSILEMHNANCLTAVCDELRTSLLQRDKDLTDTKSALEELRRHYSPDDIVITKRQAWLSGILLALISIVVSVAVGLIVWLIPYFATLKTVAPERPSPPPISAPPDQRPPAPSQSAPPAPAPRIK